MAPLVPEGEEKEQGLLGTKAVETANIKLEFAFPVETQNKGLPASETTKQTTSHRPRWGLGQFDDNKTLRTGPKFPTQGFPTGPANIKVPVLGKKGETTGGTGPEDEVPAGEDKKAEEKPEQPQKEERPKKKGMPGPIKIGFWGSIFAFLALC